MKAFVRLLVGVVAFLVSMHGMAQVPAARTISASGANVSQAYLSWDNVSEATYNVYRRPAGTGSYTRIASGYPSTYYVDQSGLPSGTSFDYYVTAVNAAGESAASQVTLTTLACGGSDCAAPSVPTGVTARAQGSVNTNDVLVQWLASTDNVAVTTYNVYRCTVVSSSCTGTVQVGSSGSAGFTDSTALAGTTYRYSVAACDAANNCSMGSFQSFNVTATAIAGSGLTITGPRAVREGGTANYSAFLVDSAGNFTSVTPSWSVASGPASINSGTGQLTTGAVTGGQQVVLNASYLEPVTSTTFNATYAVLVQEGQDAWSITNEPGQGGYVRTMQAVNGSLWVGIYAGGIHRSYDDGANWFRRTEGLTSSLVQSFSNIGGNTWLAALDGQGVFRSTDNMGTWVQSNTGLGCTFLRGFTVQSGDVYAATHGCGVYKSSDQGVSWTASNNGLPNDGADLVVYGISTTGTAGELWASTRAGIFHSTDSGASWTSKSSGIIGPNGPAVYHTRVFSGFMLAIVEGNGVFKSTDGGNSWVQSSSGLPALHIPSGMSSTHNNSRIYVPSDGHGFYVSTDAGASWQPFGTTASAIPNSRSLFQITSTSGSRLWAFAFAGVYSSDDDGATWTARNAGLPGGYTTNTTTNPSNTNEVFATADTVYKSTDGGQTWAKSNSGVRGYMHGGVVAYHPAQAGVLYVTTNSQGVYRSTDGGASWSAFNSGLPDMTGQSPNLRIDASGRVWITTENYGIFRSFSGGAWVALNTGLTGDALNVNSIDVTTGTLYAATQDGLYKSGDDGASWVKAGWSTANPGVPLNQVRVDGAANQVYWSVFKSDALGAPVAASGLYRSGDAGETATQLLASKRIRNFRFVRNGTALTLYAINWKFPDTTDWGVLRSTDNGVTWNAVVAGQAPNSNLTSLGNSIELTGGNVARIATRGQGVANFVSATSAPAAPTGVAASLSGGNNIVMSWNAVTGATGYNIYMANQAGVTRLNYAFLSGGHVHANVTSPYTHASATPGTYYLTVTAFDSTGESVESAEVAITVSATGDTQSPTVPTGLTGTAVSASRINLTWDSSTDNVGVTQYRIYRNALLLATLTGTPPATSYSDTGLVASTLYGYTVQACDGAGNCSAQSASVSTSTAAGASSFTANLEPGFNLIGNSLNLTLDVAALFGNQDAPVAGITSNIVSIWKWNAVDGRWGFYSPQLTVAGIASFAASRGYDVLATINPGEGYWVNAIGAMTLPVQSSTSFNWTSFSFGALPSGFSLIAHATTVTPSQFNYNVSATPPSPGVVPTDNFLTLWAWDAVQGKWYFYSPLLEASGGLPAVKSYADNNFYLHFQDYEKTIGIGVGFWVNRP